MANVQEHLKEAFAGESQANHKYLAFSQRAAQEGFPVVARLFAAAARAEAIHAAAHLRAMGAAGSTADNLKTAFDGETYEYTTMYPPMVELAAAQKHPAETSFRLAAAAEQKHAALYQQALGAVAQGQDLDARGVYLCPVCGNILLTPPVTPCEICGAPPEKFLTVE